MTDEAFARHVSRAERVVSGHLAEMHWGASLLRRRAIKPDPAEQSDSARQPAVAERIAKTDAALGHTAVHEGQPEPHSPEPSATIQPEI